MRGPQRVRKIMLNGRTALIVEPEFLIALDVQRMLEALGVGQTLFARTVEEAGQLGAHWSDIALAVVEIRTHEPGATQLALALKAQGIPVVLTTAELGQAKGVPEFPGLQILLKPVPEEAMASAVQQALAARC